MMMDAKTLDAVTSEAIIRVRDLTVGFGGAKVLDQLSVDVMRGEIFGLVGGSGSGKSVLLRTIVGLLPRQSGSIEVLGTPLDSASDSQRRAVERHWGVLFQQGALFSSLTVLQNIQFPIREYLRLSKPLMDEVAMAKLEMVGLSPDDAYKFPAELSGGMIKRVALARALALDPEIVFLDEPTSGLDPISAADFDELIVTLRKTLGLTVFMVTHDMESLVSDCDRVAALAGGKIVALGPIKSMFESEHPWVKRYFRGKRAEIVAQRHAETEAALEGAESGGAE